MAVKTRRPDSEFETVTLLCAEMVSRYNEQSSATNDSIGGKGLRMFSNFSNSAQSLFTLFQFALEIL